MSPHEKTAAQFHRLRPAVEAIHWPTLLTLSRPPLTRPPLTKQRLRETMRAFARLRKRRCFAAHVKGGVAALDVADKGHGWHDHIHAIVDAQWLPVKPLTHAWESIIPGGCAHVKRLNQPPKALAYILRPTARQVPADRLEEWLYAMDDHHFITTWGTCRQ
jgi:hypothetical protein